MTDIETILLKHIETNVKKETAKASTKMKNDVVTAIKEELIAVRPISLKINDKEPKVIDLAHEKTETILQYINARMAILLVGPAGSGKTHIAVQCAKLLDLSYYSISVNEQTSKSDFLGYKDAKGTLVTTNFRKAYEKGGVFIIDEVDAGNPNILTVINSALSNDMCPFPDGMIARHKDFVCICTGNTFGEGESIQYIGRNVLDAATRDRFAAVFIDYSKGVEEILIPTFKEMVYELRNHFKESNINVVVSTRGGLRLENLLSSKGEDGKLSFDDIVACLNLQSEIARDSKITTIVKKYATA